MRHPPRDDQLEVHSTPSRLAPASAWVAPEPARGGGATVGIVRADVVTIWPWWRRAHRGDGFWRLYHHDRAGAWLALPQGRALAVPAGGAVLVPPGAAFTAHPAPGVSQLYIHFEVSVPLTVARAFAAPLALRRDPALAALLAGIVRDWGALPAVGLGLRLQAAATLALALACDALSPAAASEVRAGFAGSDPVTLALAYVRERLPAPVTLGDLSAAIGVPRQRLAALFRTRLGLTPAKVIAGERLNRAEALLATTNESLDAVASACGYPSRFYLSRVFARRHGCGPIAWRRQRGG